MKNTNAIYMALRASGMQQVKVLEALEVLGHDLVKVTLVPVEVFGTECEKCHPGVEQYGLCDAVSAYSDCNRAVGHIYRRDEEDSVPYRDPNDVITIYVPRSELHKFDKKFGED